MTATARPGACAIGLLLALAAATACRPSEARPAPAADRARDVVLVTIDTCRYDALGFDGNPRGTTPNLDAVAREGLVFSQAHGQNVLTLPSHVNILTGLYPYEHGVRDNSGFRLASRFETAATLLQHRGFATGAFIAAFPLDSRYGLSRGFDVYDELYHQIEEPQDFRIQQSRADAVVRAAIDWYGKQAGRPRFLWIHLYDPHAPYDPPGPFRERFADDPYLGEVAFADDALAPLLALLRRPEAPETLLVVTADHGEARGDHGEPTHGLFAYEATLHVPLFLWSRHLARRGRDDRPARHVDVLPTILAAVGVQTPGELSGRSLLAQAPGAADEPSYFESLSASFNRGWAPLRGMIVKRLKYVELPVAELYDLAQDPAEAVNLATSRPEAAGPIRARLARIPRGAAERGAVGSEEAAKLRSLGYLSGSSAPRAAYGPERDPKNLIAVDRQLHDVVELFQGGHADQAMALASRVVGANPSMPMAYQQLAFLMQERGDIRGAIALLARGAERGAGGENMDRRRALLLCEDGRPAEAVKLLQPYAASTDGETLNAFGIALADAGRVPEGLDVFDRILAEDPGNALAHQNRGIALLKLSGEGRAAQASASLQKALSINPRNPRAWNALGVAFLRQGNAPQALDAWTNCLAYNPRQYDALYNIGIVSAENGDRARAREAFDRFVKTAPPGRYGKDIAQVREMLRRLD